MGSVALGLGEIGGALEQAKAARLKEQMEAAKLAIEKGNLGVSQQYAATNQQRLTLDQQREAQLAKLRDAEIAEIVKRVKQSPPMVQKLADAEKALGRTLTDPEKLATLGIKTPNTPQTEYQKTTDRLRAEQEMFTKYPSLARLLHPPRAAAAGRGGSSSSGQSVEDKAKDVAAGTAKLTDFPQKERGAISTYMREHKMTAQAGKLKPEMDAGLRVLHVSLWGTSSSAGLDKTVGVLDSNTSRAKLIAAGVGTTPDPKQWTVTKMAHAGFYSAMTPEEKAYVYQLNRAVSAINALRTITGLPRSTQALMDRYILELPNPVTTPSSKDARNQMQLIEREINAALAQSGTASSPSGGDVDKVLDELFGAAKVSK